MIPERLNRSTFRYFLSGFRVTHVIFVNRALSEISQAELNCLRNALTGHVQAVAVGLEIIQNRARLFFSRAYRCPGGGACRVQNNSPFLVLLVLQV